MENGNLIYRSAGGLLHSFSWLRFGVIARALLYLFVTNPANRDHALTQLLISPQQQQPAASAEESFYSFFSTAAMEQRLTTNFGLFSVKEGVMQSTVQAAGFAWDCNYDDPVIGVPVCQNLLRQQMTHRKPWLVGGD